MNSKPQISSFTWFFIGLAAGLLGMFFYHVGVRNQYAAERSDVELDYYLNQQAFKAYHDESNPVAIFALSEYLANCDRLRDRHYSFFATTDSPFSRFQAHALLARLYADSGETNLSAQHLRLALGFAQATGKYPSVTNQAALWDFIDRQYGKVGK